MGYRSDVMIMMSKDSYKSLWEQEKEAIAAGAEESLLDYIDRCNELEGEVICLEWNSIKWYPSFESVERIESFLSTLEKEDRSYYYGIIGEEINDIEERYYEGEKEGYICDAYIERSFYCSTPILKEDYKCEEENS